MSSNTPGGTDLFILGLTIADGIDTLDTRECVPI